MLDKFEQMMRDSLDNFEVEYDPSQWSALNNKMGQPKGGGSSFKWWAAGTAAVAVVTVAAFYFTGIDQSKISQSSIAGHNKVVDDHNNVSIQKDHLSEVEHNPVAGNNESDKDEVVLEENHLPEHQKTVQPVDHLSKTNDNLNKHTVVSNNNIANNNVTNNNTVVNNNTTSNDVSQVKDMNSVTAEIAKLPQPEFKSNINEVCAGSELILNATNVPEKAECFWRINGIAQNEAGNTLKLKLPDAGNTIISLSYVRKGNQSLATEKTVYVKPLPELDFSWDTEISNGKPFTRLTPHTDAMSLNWTFEDGTTKSENSPVMFFRNKGLYMVTLSGTGLNGCENKTMKAIEIEEDYNLFAPTTFTPNGDGRNDVFIPVALTVMDVDFTMAIYTRDGRLVYQTNSANKPWDGKFSNDNQNAPLGVYVWVVNIKGEDPYKGTVTLMP